MSGLESTQTPSGLERGSSAPLHSVLCDILVSLESGKKILPHWDTQFEKGEQGGRQNLIAFPGNYGWVFFSDTSPNLASDKFFKINDNLEPEMSMGFLNSVPLTSVKLSHTLNECFTHVWILCHRALIFWKMLVH